MKANKLIVFLLLVFLVNDIKAQILNPPIVNINDVDSLRRELTIAQHDTTRVQIYNSLCWAYSEEIPDSSILFGQKAIDLSRKIKFAIGEVDGILFLGFGQRYLGNYTGSLEFSLKGLKVAEENGIKTRIAWGNERVGVSFRDFGKYPEAIEYLRHSMDYFHENKDTMMVVTLQYNLARTFLEMNKIDSGYYYAQLAYEGIEKYKIPWLENEKYLIMINAFEKMGEIDSAFNFLSQLKSIKNQSLNQSIGIDYKTAVFYKRFNRIDSSIYYAEKALEKAIIGNFYSQIKSSALLLSELYKESNPKKANEYDAIIIANQDSLFRTSSLSAMNNLLNFDEQERQYEIETAQTAYKNQIRQYALTTGIGVFLLLTFIFFRNNRRKQKANAALESTLANLKSTQAQLIQSEKMASLGELTAGIAHEIQNPLNFVNNFSEVSTELIEEANEELDKGEIEEAKEILNDLKANLQKINHHGKRADSIVKGMLQHSRTSTGQKELTDINALADEYLRLSYHGLRAKDSTFNADMQTEYDKSLPRIEVIPQDIGRVLLNLINNAFQAVHERSQSEPEGYHPMVKVSTQLTPSSQEGAGGVLITISDDGPGIPDTIKDKIFQPFFTTKPTGKGTGLGLSLAYDIVKAHGGEMTVDSTEGEGTEFKIQIPLV